MFIYDTYSEMFLETKLTKKEIKVNIDKLNKKYWKGDMTSVEDYYAALGVIKEPFIYLHWWVKANDEFLDRDRFCVEERYDISGTCRIIVRTPRD